MAKIPIEMLLLHEDSPVDEQARTRLAEALPGATVGEAEHDTGAFQIEVEADDLDQALTKVWDAIAASGTDDHIVFLEHPELPEHWRSRARPAGR
jgi:hypothetical protein